MIKLKPTDVDFLMRTFVFALLLLALMHAFKPYFSDSVASADRAGVETLARQSRSITPEEIRSYLTSSTRPTMVMIYASWCSYCKKLMPNVHALWSEGKINGEQMLLISVDTKPTLLADYLLTAGFDKMVGLPLLLKQEDASLSSQLRTLGSRYRGGIPYIGFFAAGGKLTDELHGYADKVEVESRLGELK